MGSRAGPSVRPPRAAGRRGHPFARECQQCACGLAAGRGRSASARWRTPHTSGVASQWPARRLAVLHPLPADGRRLGHPETGGSVVASRRSSRRVRCARGPAARRGADVRQRTPGGYAVAAAQLGSRPNRGVPMRQAGGWARAVPPPSWAAAGTGSAESRGLGKCEPTALRGGPSGPPIRSVELSRLGEASRHRQVEASLVYATRDTAAQASMCTGACGFTAPRLCSGGGARASVAAARASTCTGRGGAPARAGGPARW